MKFIRKTSGIILAMMIVVSIFTAMPLTASAASHTYPVNTSALLDAAIKDKNYDEKTIEISGSFTHDMPIVVDNNQKVTIRLNSNRIIIAASGNALHVASGSELTIVGPGSLYYSGTTGQTGPGKFTSTGLSGVGDEVTFFSNGWLGVPANPGEKNSILDANDNIRKKYYYFQNGSMLRGWQRIGDRTYYLIPPNGEAAVGWENINKQKYYFGTDGRMVTGWAEPNGKGNGWWYFSSNGIMLVGWQQLNNRWYYFEPNDKSVDYGKMYIGWHTINKTRYYFMDTTDAKLNGSAAVGFVRINDSGKVSTSTSASFYYFSSNSAKVTGWVQSDGKWFFFDDKNTFNPGGEPGKMIAGSFATIQNSVVGSRGTTYYFENNGVVAMNKWVETTPKSNQWRYLTSSGAMRTTGWLPIGNSWYYINGNNVRLQNTFFNTPNSNVWYFLESDGKAASGWRRIRRSGNTGTVVTSGNDWYYFGPNWAMARNAWREFNGKWYYFDANGKILTGLQKPATSSQTYYFSKESSTIGVVQSGWRRLDVNGNIVRTGGSVYYFAPHMLRDTWIEWNGNWYYMKSDGKMATAADGTVRTRSGSSWTFSSSGMALRRVS